MTANTGQQAGARRNIWRIVGYGSILGTDMRGGIFTLVLAGLWVISGALFRGASDSATAR